MKNRVKSICARMLAQLAPHTRPLMHPKRGSGKPFLTLFGSRMIGGSS
jgi:hypothetical protein